MNTAERELRDKIAMIANKYSMNSRTLLKILEAEVKERKEAWEGHPECLPEQWFNEIVEEYIDSKQ